MTDENNQRAETRSATPPAPPRVNYPRLQPRNYASVVPEEYISERMNDALAWYDKNADKHKKNYLRMRAATVIGGALVPVLVNLKIPSIDIYIDITTTIISLMVVLLVSLESVYHYREQWTNYRSTEQNLRREYFLFTSKGGVYADKDKPSAYQHFVERVEEIIGAENASTLKILTSISESKADDKVKHGSAKLPG
jgi:hypothetical protein